MAQASDSVSYLAAGHQLKFGADFGYFLDDFQWNLFFPARVVFSRFPCFLGQLPPQCPGNTKSNLPFPAQFWTPILQGATGYAGVTVTHPSPGRNVFGENVPSLWLPNTFSNINHGAYGFFAQDQWRATSKLTFTYGLRYDFESYPSQLVPNEPHNGVQARAGFAYAFTGRTVLRGGFGLCDGPLVSSIGQDFVTAQWLGQGTLPNAATLASQFGYSGLAPILGRFPDAIQLGGGTQQTLLNFVSTGQAVQCLLPLFPPGNPNGCPAGTPAVLFPAFADGPSSDSKIPYTEQASLKVSHEIGGGFAFSASYLYVHAIHQDAISGNLNATQTGVVDNGPGNASQGKACYGKFVPGPPAVCGPPTTVRFPNLATLFYVEDTQGMSVYHGGTAEIEKRFSHGFSPHGSYTFERATSNYESVANLADFPQSQNRSLERAVSRQTVPQRFTFAFVSAVPDSVRVLHRFNFSTLVSTQSGQFYNVFAGSDVNRDTNSLNDRPGTLGRDTLKGPNIISWDMRVGRDLHFSERLSGELTFDLFNVTNRLNVSDLNTVCGCDLPAAIFAPANLQATSSSLNPLLLFNTPRQTLNLFQFQYGLKLHF